MSDAETPIRFELSINGNHIATGGVKNGVIDAHVLGATRTTSGLPNLTRKSEEVGTNYDHMVVELGGVDGDDFVLWIKEEPVKIGDEIVVRILGPGSVDAPNYRRSQKEITADAAAREAGLRELDENLDRASLDLLGCLNSSAEEFSASMHRYQHAASQLISALTKACGESAGDVAEELDNRRNEAHDATRGFRRHLLAYRKSKELATSDGSAT